MQKLWCTDKIELYDYYLGRRAKGTETANLWWELVPFLFLGCKFVKLTDKGGYTEKIYSCLVSLYGNKKIGGNRAI